MRLGGPGRHAWVVGTFPYGLALTDPHLLWEVIDRFGGTDPLFDAEVDRHFGESAVGCAVVRDVFGNPFRPVTFDSSWLTSTAVSLARGMYDAREFSPMPILADALQDAGCDNDDILGHCRDPKQTHVRGCWVVDMVLGKE